MHLLRVLVVAGLFSWAAQGADLFTCKVKEGRQTVTVKFAVKNLSKPRSAHLLGLTGDESLPIIVKPEMLKSGYVPQMATLNDQGGDLRVTDEYLKLFGDGDGYTLVDLVLYKNSGYTKGYVKVYGSVDRWYQAIRCTRARM